MLLYEPNSDTVVELADQPFASGGEGKLYRIEGPSIWSKHVAKIYHPNKRTENREAKLRYLINHPPKLREDGHQSIIWPTAILYAQHQMMGFLMPMAYGEKLEILCTPKLPRKLDGTWQRFAQHQRGARQLRLKLCYNIAVALHQIHETEHYVLVDLKPDNIMVQPNGLISIVDSDSIEIIDNGSAIFPGRVATPEYTPPESYRGVQPGKDTIFPSWDHFSLAVIFYRLLLGIHPFAASFGTPYEGATALPQKIEAGLFVQGKKGQRYIKVAPPIHQKFEQLPEAVRALFRACFEEGDAEPSFRPTAEEWCSAISGRQRMRVVRPLPSEKLEHTANRQLPQQYDFEFEASPVLEIEGPKVLATRPPVSFGHLSKGESQRYIFITGISAFILLNVLFSGLSIWFIVFGMLFTWKFWRKIGYYVAYYTHKKFLQKTRLKWKLRWIKIRSQWMRPQLMGLNFKRRRLNKRMRKKWQKQLSPVKGKATYQKVLELYERKAAFLEEKDEKVKALCLEEENAFRTYRQEQLEAFKHLTGMNLEHKVKRLEKIQERGDLSMEQLSALNALRTAQAQLDQKRAALKAVYDKRYEAFIAQTIAEWNILSNRLQQEEQDLRSALDGQVELREELKNRYEEQVMDLRGRYKERIEKARALKTRRQELELEVQRYEEINLETYKNRF